MCNDVWNCLKLSREEKEMQLIKQSMIFNHLIISGFVQLFIHNFLEGCNYQLNLTFAFVCVHANLCTRVT